jgi:beta-phosphoglucomutase-like phosphatase (HAD superfamily)
LPGQCVVIEDSEVGIEAAAAAGMNAFQYVRNGETPLSRAGDAESFDDMLKLPQLLAQLASSTRPTVPDVIA